MDKINKLLSLGISKAKVGQKIGLSPNYLENIIRNNRSLQKGTKERINKYYNDTLFSLLSVDSFDFLKRLLREK